MPSNDGRKQSAQVARHVVEVSTDALVGFAGLATEWGITANTVSRRLAFLGIKPIRQGNFRFITADDKALADDLNQHILSGKPMDAFPRKAGGEASTIVKRDKAQVAPQVADLVQALSFIHATQSSADPLRRAKALAEAADLSLVLGTDELVALGVKGVEGFADGDCAYGYAFAKHHQRGRTLWTISRSLIQRELPPTKALPKQPVGFGLGIEACVDLVPMGIGNQIFALNSL
ncbi:MAG: hypothetical protein NT142_10670 [Planctomycetota bacterium]|nr:hypothetical protein [Planctomycetota bacterium]